MGEFDIVDNSSSKSQPDPKMVLGVLLILCFTIIIVTGIIAWAVVNNS